MAALYLTIHTVNYAKKPVFFIYYIYHCDPESYLQAALGENECAH